MKRLNIGIDLALTGKHRASIYDPQKQEHLDNSFSFDNSYEGYEYLLKQVNKYNPEKEDIELKFIMEPTSLAWMPLCCYLNAKRQQIYRITTQKSSDLRKFLEHYTKSDRVDTKALALAPEVDKKGIYELYLPTTDLGTLGRYCKQMAKLTKEVSKHKVRIESIFTMVNPKVLEAFRGDKFSIAGRTYFKYFSNPYKIVNMGKEAFFEEFREKSNKEIDEKVLEYIYKCSLSTYEIYLPLFLAGKLPFNLDEVDEEIQTEMRIIEFLEGEIKRIQEKIDVYYKKADPSGILKTIRGIGEKIAPAIRGLIGDVRRFKNIKAFRKFFGFIPRKKQSSNKDKKGQKMCKASQNILKSYIYLAAEVARQWDPEYAAFYNRLMKKDMHHYAAICALGNKMAGRIYAILMRMEMVDKVNSDELSYKIRDLDGNIISQNEARKIVQEKFPSKAQKDEVLKQKNKKGRESLSSQNHNIPRQSHKQFANNSSKRSCKTLPAKDIINNIISGAYLQDSELDDDKREFFALLSKLYHDLEQNIPVDKFCKDSGNFLKKTLDLT
jgi:transposase